MSAAQGRGLSKATALAPSFVRKASGTLQAVTSLLLFLMMLLITTEVVLRYVFRTSLKWSFDVTAYMVVAIVFLGLAWVQVQHKHVRMDFFIRHSTGKRRVALEIVALVLGIVLFSLITWRSWTLAWYSLGTGSTSMGQVPLPLFPSQVVVPLGSFVLCLQFLVDLCREIRSLRQAKMSSQGN